MSEPDSPQAAQSDFAFNNRHLRFIFVAFLFSAAVARLGDGAYALIGEAANWSIPAFSHLVLAFAVITMSWVNWASRIGGGPLLKDIFTLQYVLLFLDLILVLLYIGIVKSAEIPSSKWSTAPSPRPSAVPESVLLASIYGLYAFWDLLHDVVEKEPKDERPKWLQTLAACGVRCGASIVSLAVALSIAACAYWMNINSAFAILLLNFAELSNAVLFRALKVFEYPFDKSLHPIYRENADRYEDKRRRLKVFALVSLVACISAIGAAVAMHGTLLAAHVETVSLQAAKVSTQRP